MPKCKICGEDVRAGTVMHVECMEKMKAEIEAKRLELQEREEMLDMREKAQDFREGFLDFYCKKILAERKKAKRDRIFGLALAVLTIVLSILNLMM